MSWKEIQNSNIGWAKLKVHVPGPEIANEFKNIKHLVKYHRADYGAGWQSITLHGFKPHYTEGINHYKGFENFKDHEFEYHWTDIAAECPKTVEFIKSLPYERLQRVRFMYLKAGGLIDYHRDVNKYNLSPMNISINNPYGCEFNIFDQMSNKDKTTIPFKDNTAFLVNIGHYHRVINRSKEDRLHMIVHGKFTNNFYNNYNDYIEEWGTM